MPWEPLKLINRSGEPLQEYQREIILSALEKTVLAAPNATMEALLRTTNNVARNIDRAKNAIAYTKRSFFRVERSTQNAERNAKKKRVDLYVELMPEQLESSQPSPLETTYFREQQKLLHTRLEQLEALDRKIYETRVDGYSFLEIDKSLKLEPGTSEQRYRTTKRRLCRG